MCYNPQIPGITYDGGYADYVIAQCEALAHIPDDLSAVEAAPLMCAGITTFNSLRNSGARAGDVVAVLGIGGLGHLGLQYAAKMGFKTVANSRGTDKEPQARKLGAYVYIDSEAEDVSESLLRLGGAKAIVATAPSGKAMTSALRGLRVDGKLSILGASDEPVEVDTVYMIQGRRSVVGWPSGTSIDSDDTLSFSGFAGVRPITEIFPP